MSLNFGVPNSQFSRTSHPNAQDPLRAEGNLGYLDFIRLIQYLWGQVNPDVPLLATQSGSYAVYPCIVYGLELRKPFKNEPKRRHREFVVDEDENMYRISAQRFDNIVTFTVLTRNEPELADQLIEMFEDFMIEQDAVIKQLGASEFFYSRRLSDRELTRNSEDVCARAVAYLLTTEKLFQMSVDRLESIVINAQKYMYEAGDIFEIDSDMLVLPGHNLDIGDRVMLQSLVSPTGAATPVSFPDGLHEGWIYLVSAIDGNKISLTTIGGAAVTGIGDGQGRLIPWAESGVRVLVAENFLTNPA